MNADSGIVNGDSGKPPKAFTLNRNDCSRSPGISVHNEPERVFTLGRNTQAMSLGQLFLKVGAGCRGVAAVDLVGLLGAGFADNRAISVIEPAERNFGFRNHIPPI